MKGYELLKEARRLSGMKQKDMAKYFYMPYRTYQDWELGNRVIPEYILRLVEVISRASVLKKYGSHRLCDGCLSIIGKINLLIDKWITWAYYNSRKHWTSAQRM